MGGYETWTNEQIELELRKVKAAQEFGENQIAYQNRREIELIKEKEKRKALTAEIVKP